MIPISTLATQSASALLTRLRELEPLCTTPEVRQKHGLLIAKAQEEEATIAFCGHFSAGKSTFVNRLAGGQVLPASPIPTSANRVIIRHGDPEATVWLRDQGKLYLPPADLEQLSSLCTDGDRVEAVELRYPLACVPHGLALLDTPGIDSNDDAHRIATESALYLAEVVFYVMDYNHVQSEVNCHFTRSLMEWGKPLYLIINQVDKHIESEIPFGLFQRSVAEAFANWGVFPEAIFYISLREADHPLNQWEKLQAAMRRIAAQKKELLHLSLYRSAKHLMADALGLTLQAEMAEREQLLADQTAGGEQAEIRAAAISAELDRLDRRSSQLVQEITREIGSLLSNAPLFPYATRELARSYLEARKPNFRMGFLFTKRKTETEVVRRLALLHVSLQEKVSAHVHWHLREMLLTFALNQGLSNERLTGMADAIAPPLEREMLAAMVQSGSLGTDEYLFHYTKAIATEIQLRYRKAVKPVIDQLAADATAQTARESVPLQEEAQRMANALQAARQLAALDQQAADFQANWMAVLGDSPAVPHLSGDGCETGTTIEPDADSSQSLDRNQEAPAISPLEPELLSEFASAPMAVDRRSRAAVAKLQAAARLLSPFPGMARTAADLLERADRLAQSQFTVALFGAFSAGKSSFANALLGSVLLPVSPNPTTAVINRIMPPDPEHPHGHVTATWKEESQVRQEVERSLSALSIAFTGELTQDLEQGLSQSKRSTSPIARPHEAFLAAAHAGFRAAQECLGTVQKIPLHRFARVVANEQESCFLTEIAVHLRSPLAEKGITLVDTPGADSINARHTDVAFDYIKKADAVLFVMYYNHAFAKADREFLIQLGRVKDAFALDKMFFIINAADLAASPAELAAVQTHVRSQLAAFGIRQPRLFPLSSQTALWSRLWEHGKLPQSLCGRLQGGLSPLGTPAEALEASGIRPFEEQFYHFTVTELSQMAINGAMTEVERATSTILHWLEAAQSSEESRLVQRTALTHAERQAHARVNALPGESERRGLEQEVDELLYYVKQRVLHRYRDLFVESFNPSVLRNDTPELKRVLLDALKELLQSVAFDLSQEMRATALRVENGMNRQLQRFADRLDEAVAPLLPSWSAPACSPLSPAVPTFSEGEEVSSRPYRSLLSLFRSPAHFFAGGGRHQLRDELGKAIEPSVADYLAVARALLVQCYGSAFADGIEALRVERTAGISEYLCGLRAALFNSGEAERLSLIARELQQILVPDRPDMTP